MIFGYRRDFASRLWKSAYCHYCVVQFQHFSTVADVGLYKKPMLCQSNRMHDAVVSKLLAASRGSPCDSMASCFQSYSSKTVPNSKLEFLWQYFFTGRMPFQLPNQQLKSTKGWKVSVVQCTSYLCTYFKSCCNMRKISIFSVLVCFLLARFYVRFGSLAEVHVLLLTLISIQLWSVVHWVQSSEVLLESCSSLPKPSPVPCTSQDSLRHLSTTLVRMVSNSPFVT